jgi:hypothetical protein
MQDRISAGYCFILPFHTRNQQHTIPNLSHCFSEICGGSGKSGKWGYADAMKGYKFALKNLPWKNRAGGPECCWNQNQQRG